MHNIFRFLRIVLPHPAGLKPRNLVSETAVLTTRLSCYDHLCRNILHLYGKLYTNILVLGRSYILYGYKFRSNTFTNNCLPFTNFNYFISYNVVEPN